MPLVTIDELRERLAWLNIREKKMPEYRMRWFSAVPDDESHPSVDFLFDENVEFLQQLGSGEWHCHPDDINRAIELARKLIHHETCILEERNKKGEYSGSGPVAPTEVAGTLRLDTDHFVRRFFGRAPVREAIDFTRYIKGKHLYVERRVQAESIRVWALLGQQPPEF